MPGPKITVHAEETMITAVRPARLAGALVIAITLAVLVTLVMMAGRPSSPGGYVAQSTAAVLD
jgi:hypothetical protein